MDVRDASVDQVPLAAVAPRKLENKDVRSGVLMPHLPVVKLQEAAILLRNKFVGNLTT